MTDTPRQAPESRDKEDRTPNPANKQEAVEDRPNVSTVTPEDYPKDSRAAGDKA